LIGATPRTSRHADATPRPSAALRFVTLSASLALAAAHGNMIHPQPRQAHGQVLDKTTACACQTAGTCYSNVSKGAYCGPGCIGNACLYYAIGCFQGCGTCSYEGKTL